MSAQETLQMHSSPIAWIFFHHLLLWGGRFEELSRRTLCKFMPMLCVPSGFRHPFALMAAHEYCPHSCLFFHGEDIASIHWFPLQSSWLTTLVRWLMRRVGNVWRTWKLCSPELQVTASMSCMKTCITRIALLLLHPSPGVKESFLPWFCSQRSLWRQICLFLCSFDCYTETEISRSTEWPLYMHYIEHNKCHL